MSSFRSFLQYTGDFHFGYNELTMSSNRITGKNTVRAAWTYRFCSSVSNISLLSAGAFMKEPFPLFQTPCLSILSGPPFKMESDLVTLKIWPRLQCKIKCLSFTVHENVSAFTQKKKKTHKTPKHSS